MWSQLPLRSIQPITSMSRIPPMWRHGLMNLARGFAQLIFPNTCLICDVAETDPCQFRHGLCIDCHRAVTADLRPCCPRCGVTVGPHTDVAEGCMACRDLSLGFESVIRLGP